VLLKELILNADNKYRLNISSYLFSMRKKIVYLILLFSILQYACERHKQQQSGFEFKPPKVVKAKTYKVPPEKMMPPKVIPLSGVKKIVAGKPEIVKLKPNIFPARAQRIIPAGTSKLFIPNGESFRSPKVVPAIDSPFIAGPPEIIILKDPFIKENNPESFSSIKAMHGLNSNEISSLCQDKAGNLWIGAWWGGVSKYDGRSLTNYSTSQGLSSDVVSSILEDKRGNIWIGTTNAGVHKFDGRYITRYSTTKGLGDNFVWNMMQDKNGDMWFATDSGLSRYDGHSFTHYTTAQGLPSDRVRGMLEDSKGNLWFGAYGGLTRFDGHSFQNYTIALDLKDSTEVISIQEDSKGNVWFGTNNGLFKYDGQYISQFTAEGGLSSNRITKIIKDNTGDLWIATWDHGVNRYDGTSFIHLGVEQGLSNETVPAVLQDKCGNIWLATTAGVCKYDGKLFNHIVPIRQEEVECIAADKNGNIWIGSGVGSCVNKYDGRSFARFTTKQGLINTSINQILEDRYGNIWFGSRGGVDKYDGRYFTHYGTANGLIHNAVFCMLEDKKGNLWFGTEKGLSKFDGKSFTNYSIAQGLSGETIYSILEDHLGNLWIGTSDKGVCTFDGVSFTHYDMAHSLSNAMVIGMIEDENHNIWFCTSMGVNKFDGKYFTWYTTEQGLSNNIVKNVLEDKNGNVWVGTINGMNRLILQATQSDILKNTGSSLFKKYTVSEGFSGGGTYENSITQDSSGNIWIGANDRVANYHPTGDIPDTIPPTIQLSGVALFDENINWLDVEKKKDTTLILGNGTRFSNFNFSSLSSWHNQPQNLQLAYNNNYITFQFIGITTNRPKEVRYRYFLDGLDEDWSTVTDKPEATYNNLPPGNYTFKVKAVNSEGYWSNELVYPLTIHPPWWHTSWAYTLYILIFLVSLWSFIKWRESALKKDKVLLEKKVVARTHELQKEKEKVDGALTELKATQAQLIQSEKTASFINLQQAMLNERLRISRELHDDIGSTLSGIVLYSHLAEDQVHGQRAGEAKNSLNIIQQSANEMVNRLSDIVWAVNPEHIALKDLIQKLEEYAKEMAMAKNIKVQVNVPESLVQIQLPVESRHNIYLIGKEAINNAIKYSHSSLLELSAHHFDHVIEFTIKDNGNGFDMATVKKGNGLINMQKRADEAAAILSVQSVPQQGTLITLQCKIT
jgi:ligand-binding sensor domain-containing protein/signal transduction histidine kinase